MDGVTSGDGTAIAFERFGDGPPVVAERSIDIDRTGARVDPKGSHK